MSNRTKASSCLSGCFGVLGLMILLGSTTDVEKIAAEASATASLPLDKSQALPDRPSDEGEPVWLSPQATPQGMNLQLIHESGPLISLARANLGGYEIHCDLDDVICSPHFFDWPYSAALAPDRDFVPGGESPECECPGEPQLIINPSISQLDLPGLTEFIFIPGTDGYGQDPYEPCNKTVSSKSRSRAYNNCVFTIRDVDGVYAGNVKIEIQLEVYGTPQQNDGLPGVASWIRQQAHAAYNSPPLVSGTEPDCPPATAFIPVARFLGPLPPYDKTADETKAILPYTSPWFKVTPTGGIPQNQTFSLGFEFVTEGGGACESAGGMVLRMRFTPEP